MNWHSKEAFGCYFAPPSPPLDQCEVFQSGCILQIQQSPPEQFRGGQPKYPPPEWFRGGIEFAQGGGQKNFRALRAWFFPPPEERRGTAFGRLKFYMSTALAEFAPPPEPPGTHNEIIWNGSYHIISVKEIQTDNNLALLNFKRVFLQINNFYQFLQAIYT